MDTGVFYVYDFEYWIGIILYTLTKVSRDLQAIIYQWFPDAADAGRLFVVNNTKVALGTIKYPKYLKDLGVRMWSTIVYVTIL